MDCRSVSTINNLQYLRGLAALMVVFAHSSYVYINPTMFGAAGVDIFFFISGSVIYLSYGKSKTGPFHFFYRRASRVVPLYWIVNIFYATKFYLTNEPNFTLKYFICSLFFIPQHSSMYAGKIWPLVVQGWTLNYEMLFYLIFTISIWLSQKKAVIFAGLLIIALTVVGGLLSPADSVLAFYSRPQILEFVGGMALAHAHTSGWLTKRPWLGLGLPIGAMLLLGAEESEAYTQGIAWGIAGGLIVLGAMALEGWWVSRSAWLPRVLGDASYSIYITHLLTFHVLCKLVTSGGIVAGLGFWGLAAANLCASAIVGVFLYWLVERPILTAMRRAWRPRAVPGTSHFSAAPVP